MKKVLIIAYHFPPIGGSGMQRAVKFVKYLMSFGWEPVILSVKKKRSYELADGSLMNDIPKDTKIYRTTWFNPYGIFKIPNKNIGWLPFAFLKGLSILRQEKIDVIYSTSPTETAHLIAYLLKKATRLPWVADFRDPWIGNPARADLKGSRQKIERYLERKVIYSADKIITNTDYLKDDFKRRYPDIDEKKFVTITNGYDPEDFISFEGYKNITSNGRFVITHTGEFYDAIRNPDNFLKAAAILLKECKLKKEDVLINFIGSGEYTQMERYKCLIKDHQLEETVNEIDHLPHNECIKYLYSSHILLLFAFSDGRLQIPAKTYEYIKVGKPILAIAETGATSALLDKIKTAVIVDPNDISGIKEAIHRFYVDFKNQRLKLNTDEGIKARFDRRSLTKSLAAVFDSLIIRS